MRSRRPSTLEAYCQPGRSMGVFKRTFLSAVVAAAACSCVFAQQPGPALSIDAAANRPCRFRPISTASAITGISATRRIRLGAKAAAASDVRAPAALGRQRHQHLSLEVRRQQYRRGLVLRSAARYERGRLEAPRGVAVQHVRGPGPHYGRQDQGTIPVLGLAAKGPARKCAATPSPNTDAMQGGSVRASIIVRPCGDGVDKPLPRANPIPPTSRTTLTTPTRCSMRSLQAEWVKYLGHPLRQGATRAASPSGAWTTSPSGGTPPIATSTPIPTPTTKSSSLNIEVCRGGEAGRSHGAGCRPGQRQLGVAVAVEEGHRRGMGKAGRILVESSGPQGARRRPVYRLVLAADEEYAAQHGKRLLDYLDLHAYINPARHPNEVTADSAGIRRHQGLRLDSTRELWDPTYMVADDYWIKDVENGGGPVAPTIHPPPEGDRRRRTTRAPRSRSPSTTGTAPIRSTAAWRRPSILGIFGREGLDLATLWGPTKPTDPLRVRLQDVPQLRRHRRHVRRDRRFRRRARTRGSCRCSRRCARI